MNIALVVMNTSTNDAGVLIWNSEDTTLSIITQLQCSYLY